MLRIGTVLLSLILLIGVLLGLRACNRDSRRLDSSTTITHGKTGMSPLPRVVQELKELMPSTFIIPPSSFPSAGSKREAMEKIKAEHVRENE